MEARAALEQAEELRRVMEELREAPERVQYLSLEISEELAASQDRHSPGP